MARYKLMEKLGSGGMGVVYRALQVDLDRVVALKMLRRAEDEDAQRRRERFAREIEACIRLQHPNIIQIYDHGEMDGHLYYTMELIEARSLDDLVEARGPLPAPRILRILSQIVDALALCHQRGLVHRDVKPQNLMLKQSGEAILMDFGLTRFSEKDALTVQGTMVGTPRFMAPEIIRGEPATPAVDIYALGASAYELACGQPAFDDSRDLKTLLWSVLSDRPTPPSTIHPQVPGDLEALILGMMEKDADDRPGALDVWHDIRLLLERHDPEACVSLDSIRNPVLDTRARPQRSTQRIAYQPAAPDARRRTRRDRTLGTGPSGEPEERNRARPSGSDGERPGDPTLRSGAPGAPGPATARGRLPARLALLGVLGAVALLGLIGSWRSWRAGPSPPVRVRLTALRVEPTSPRHLAVSLEAEGGSPGTLDWQIAGAGGEIVDRGSVPGSSFVLRTPAPDTPFDLVLRDAGGPIEGGRRRFRTPAPVTFVKRRIFGGEDFVLIWIETIAPHRFEVTIQERGSETVVRRWMADEPVRRSWRLFEGLAPTTSYRVTIADRDKGHQLLDGAWPVTTRDRSFRKEMAATIRTLQYSFLPDTMAAAKLYEILDPRSVGEVARILDAQGHDGAVETYNLLVHTIGEVGDERHLPVLYRLLETARDPERELRCLSAIGDFGPAASFDAVMTGLERRLARKASGLEPWQGVYMIGTALTRIDRERAVEFATRVADRAADQPLAARTLACDVLMRSRLREPAARGLGRLARHDPDPRIRAQAVIHLTRIGGPAALAQTLSTLEALDPAKDPELAGRLVLALGVLGDDRTVERIAGFLQPGYPEEVKLRAALALGNLRASSAVPALLGALVQVSTAAKPMFIWALGQLGPGAGAARRLLEGMATAGETSRGQLPLALALIGGPESVPLLRTLADRAANDTAGRIERAHALLALGLLDDAGSERRLIAALESETLVERGLAVHGLALGSFPGAVAALEGIVGRAGEDERVRGLALKGLFLKGAPAALRLAERLAGDRRGAGRKLGEKAERLLARVPASSGRRASVVRAGADPERPERGSGRTWLVPAFLPFHRTGIEVHEGERLSLLPLGLWSEGPGDEVVGDEQGIPPFHVYRHLTMALLSCAGFSHPRNDADDTGNFAGSEGGRVLFLANPPLSGDDPVYRYVPRHDVLPRAWGFMTVHELGGITE